MYSRILIPLDNSESTSPALDAAIGLARVTGAELQPLYVIDIPVIVYEVPGFDPSIARDACLEQSRIVCGDAQARMTMEGVKGTPRSAEVQLGAEDVGQCIERVAADWHAGARRAPADARQRSGARTAPRSLPRAPGPVTGGGASARSTR